MCLLGFSWQSLSQTLVEHLMSPPGLKPKLFRGPQSALQLQIAIEFEDGRNPNPKFK